MPAKPSAKSPTPVLATKHKDKRANIPTEELRDFVADDEKAPKKILYPRDPSLDPQLVWKGKDEQDSQPLEVPAVPIYIQEKIHPQVIIEDLRRNPPHPSLSPTGGEGAQRAGEGAAGQDQLNLFASDFNGLKFEHLIEFYQHKDGVKWANRMILGDSLLVMNSLAEKEGLKERVQMIYIDPPYGIKFGSNWQVSTRKRDVKDGKAEDATRQPEQIRAFRDTWKLGIHSYLAYLRDRLTVARELLTESGSVFVQIGDENVHLVRNLLDEVFGSENFISLITVRKTGGTTGTYLQGTADYLLCFGKDVERTKYRSMFRLKDSDSSEASSYDLIELPDGSQRRMTEDERLLAPQELAGKRFQLTILTSPRIREARTGYYPIQFEGVEYFPSAGEWKTHREGIERLRISNRIGRAGSTIRYVRYLEDFPATILTNTWTDLGGASDPVYVVQTNTEIVKRCLLMTTDPGDLVLDPTCASGTTAFVAEQWGRRWITCDTSRVAIALARTRLMAAKFPYYLLADSEDGWRKEMEATGKFISGSAPASGAAADASSAASAARGVADEGVGHNTRGACAPQKFESDIKRGFVYKRVPHVTLKSIANNEEIDAIHAEFASRIEKALAALNKAVGRVPSRGAGSGDPAYKEWEVPREIEPLINANPGSSKKKLAKISAD